MLADKTFPKVASQAEPNVVTGVRRRLLTWHTHITPSLSIIVPTLNERENVEALLSQINQVLQKTEDPFEVIFVDDSTDDTPQVIQKASRIFPFDMVLIERSAQKRTGLGTAVVEGIRVARGDWVCVMDGDLQHPPEVIPQLLAKAEATGSDLVAGSRLAEGGGTDGLSAPRKLVSHGLALTSHILFPARLKKISDPLTGFFLFRRNLVDPECLHPDGFKILLDILVRCPKLNVAEVPFKFGERYGGESKASTQQVLYLFRHYGKLLFASHLNLIRFLIVGAIGILVNSVALAAFSELLGIYYLVAAVLATQVSTLSNFGGTEWWVFRNRSEELQGSRGRRLFSFLAMNNAALLLRGPFLALLVSFLGMHYLVANLLSLVLFTILRFGLSERVIWNEGETTKKLTEKAFQYNYNIHDVIRIRSMQRLPELGYFQTSQSLPDADFEVLIDRNVAAYKQEDSICYDELFGKFGFSIVINRNESGTEVVATPTISRSPHVLYTNVIEPLLRWHLVRKGYALMHGATLSFDGKAVFITAQTDTGKTTTILHTIRNSKNPPKFLSDDMTIFSPDGKVLSYPKPLTISQHTVHAIGGAPLSLKERMFLKVQSRLHSRGGRRIGLLLSAKHFPAASLNALVQTLIPPPKFMVHKLVPHAKYEDEAELCHIVLIERGPSYQGEIPKNDRATILLENADDAYGFPPYPVLADQLSRWQGKDMHETEQELVEEMIKWLPATHLRSDHYDWYEHIPRLVNGEELKVRRQPSKQQNGRTKVTLPKPELNYFPPISTDMPTTGSEKV
jgi:glycosyltransferase involved in cell wall biosynthesis